MMNRVKELITRFRDWWNAETVAATHITSLQTQQFLLANQERLAREHAEAMKELWLKLAQWWQQEYIALKPPGEWPKVGELGFIGCPICGHQYDIRNKIPDEAAQATITCAQKGCGEAMELFKDPYYGWLKPRVEYRERSYR